MAAYTYCTTSTNVWNNWVSYPNSATTTNYIVTGEIGNYPGVWAQWVNTGTASTTVVWQDNVWTGWVEDEEAAEERRLRLDEVQAMREQRSRERLAEEQARMVEREAAEAVARELLDGLLTEAERADLETLRLIEVVGQDGHTYRVETHRETVHGNIVRVDEHGCVLGRACVAPRMYFDDGPGGALPTSDGWVGQYLGLKFDTEEFLSHANWSQARACQQQAA